MVAQLLAQLADVTLDHVLVEARIEQSVNGVEELGFRQPFSLMLDQALKRTQLATRQSQYPAADFGVPAVEKNTDQAGRCFVRLPASSANDRSANQNLANMNRDVNNVVDASLEQLDGVLE